MSNDEERSEIYIQDEINKQLSLLKKDIKKQEKKKREKPVDPIGCATVYDPKEDILYQLINDETYGYGFWESKNGKEPQPCENPQFIWVGYQEYTFLNGEELTSGAVILPPAPINYKDNKELNTKIKNHVLKYLDIPTEYLELCVHQIKFSWVHQVFNTVNYNRAIGEFGSGKSRFLDVLGDIHYIPMKTQGAASTAPIFRLINKWGGTLIIDEADVKDSDEKADLIKILNCGYEKGRPVMRCDTNDVEKLRFFDVFCPKILATRRFFEDKATESRCFTNVMRPTFRKDIPKNLTKQYAADVKELQGMLLMFRFRNYTRVDPETFLKYEDRMDQYEARLQQISAPYLAMVDNNKDEVEHFFTFLDKYQGQLINERVESFDGQIVSAIAAIILEQTAPYHITATDVSDRMKDGGYTTKNGFNHRGVGRSMRTLGLEVKQKKISGRNQKILNLNDDSVICFLESCFNKYVHEPSIKMRLKMLGFMPNLTQLSKNNSTPKICTDEKKKGNQVTKVTKVAKGIQFLKNDVSEEGGMSVTMVTSDTQLPIAHEIGVFTLIKDLTFLAKTFNNSEFTFNEFATKLKVEDSDDIWLDFNKMVQDGDIVETKPYTYKLNR